MLTRWQRAELHTAAELARRGLTRRLAAVPAPAPEWAHLAYPLTLADPPEAGWVRVPESVAHGRDRRLPGERAGRAAPVPVP